MALLQPQLIEIFGHPLCVVDLCHITAKSVVFPGRAERKINKMPDFLFVCLFVFSGHNDKTSYDTHIKCIIHYIKFFSIFTLKGKLIMQKNVQH